MYYMRKLTPLECWRLTEFDDIDFMKAQQAGVSATQLYKQAGNSIVVDVLCCIFENLLKDVENVSLNELFAGIGSQAKALKKLGKLRETVGISEIDSSAIMSYEAVHGAVRNYGDISCVEELDYADFWTYSFPCTDVSIAGKQAGLVKDETRSGLLYEVQRLLQRAIDKGQPPKYLMLENVKNLLSSKFKAQFESWLAWLESKGYTNYYAVLNARDYGMPQNRERVFAVSIRNDVDDGTFTLPQPFDNGKRLIDIMDMDDELQEKYAVNKAWVLAVLDELNSIDDGLLSKEEVIHQVIQKHNRGTKHQQDDLQSAYGVCKCIPAGTHGSTPHHLKTVYWKD